MEDKKITIFSIVFLIVSLIIIYFIYFMNNSNKIGEIGNLKISKTENQNEQSINTLGNNKSNLDISDDISQETEQNLKRTSVNYIEKDNSTNFEIGEENIEVKKVIDNIENEINNKEIQNNQTINYFNLTGVSIFDGEKDKNIEKLGLNYTNIFIDNYGILYYVFENQTLNYQDLKNVVNVVEINDKININKNSLFGDKIVFINFDDYKNKYVVFVSEFNNKNLTFLIKVKVDIYYKYKEYLKNMFSFYNN